MKPRVWTQQKHISFNHCRLWDTLVWVLVLLVAMVVVGCTDGVPVTSAATPVPAEVSVPDSQISLVPTFTPMPVSAPAGVSVSGSQTSATASLDEPSPAMDDIPAMVSAANAFLAALAPSQRTSALLPFGDPRRANWSNLPAGVLRFERNGVRIGDLDNTQTAAMMTLLALGLSPEGLNTVLEVVGAEGVLAQSARASRLGWSEDNYWLAFFGQPSTTEPWGWQFGGHHLAVNMTIDDGRITMSPSFIGIEPASYVKDTYTVAPFAAEVDAGLALINMLAEPLQAMARMPGRPRQILTGAGQDGVLPTVEGSRVADWDMAQQQALLATIALWVTMLPEHSARLRLAEIESGLADTYFAWHGPMDGSGAIYYRIQGPALIIEFSTEGDLGDDGGHYHTMYRDPTNEYGQR